MDDTIIEKLLRAKETNQKPTDAYKSLVTACGVTADVILEKLYQGVGSRYVSRTRENLRLSQRTVLLGRLFL